MKDIRDIHCLKDIEDNISTMTLITNLETKIDLSKLLQHLHFVNQSDISISMPKNKKGEELPRTFKNQVPLFIPFQEKTKENTFNIRNVKTKVFNNGRLHITGCKTVHMMQNIVDKVIDLIHNSKSNMSSIHEKNAKNDNVQIVMMNTTISSGFEINQEKFKDILISEYDIYASFKPKTYAGIIAKYEINNVLAASFLIFKSGKIIVAGAKQLDMLEQSISKMSEILLSKRQQIELL